MSFLTTMGTAFNSVKNTCSVHSPEILTAVGAASIIGGIVLTIKNSTKASDILEERKAAIEDLKALQEDNQEEYPEEIMEKDIRKVNTNTAVGLVKTYAPGIVLTVAGILSMGSATFIANHRFKEASMAFTTLSGAFAAYRQRAKEVFGDDADDKIMYGIETKKKQKVEVVDPETGEVKTETRDVKIASNPYGASPYAMWFDEDTSYDWDKNMDVNLGFVKGVEAQANDRLKYRGKHAFLSFNEVRCMLGCKVPMTREGGKTGWNSDSKTGDRRVIIKTMIVDREIIDEAGNPTGKYKKSLLIDFNVDGYILDEMPSERFVA